MKNTLLCITVFLFLVVNSKAQPWLPELEEAATQKSELTFYEIQKIVNDYYSSENFEKGYYYIDGDKQKAPGWKQFKRWEWYWDSRVELKTGAFPKTSATTEWNDYIQNKDAEKSVSGNWVSLGPDVSVGGYAGIGRINCITFHPSDTNTYWVGSPSGGLWETTDDGQSWMVLTDENTVLGVSDIAVPSDYESSQTIYIATGDRDGGSVWTLGGAHYYDNHTIGVLKSTDGGANWSATGLTYNTNDIEIIGRLLIDTTDNQTLFASTYNGIYKTTDGGANWNQKLTTNYVIDMEFKPGDPTTIYASTNYSNNPKIYRSTDGGDNWTTVATFGSGSRRVELAVTPHGPDYIYAIVSNTSGGLYGIYKSRDGGDNFELVFDGDETNHYLLNYYSDGSGDGNTGQGNYDLAIAVAPNDTNTVYIGGINTWKSEDGGYSWTINNMWTAYSGYNFVNAPVVHADKHVLSFRDSTALFEGNDGGIYKTNNEGANWTDLSNDMTISQLYRIGLSESSENLIIAGLQDNGTKVYNNGSWSDVKGGDGMECIIDPTDDNIQYGTYVNGEIERTTDGWTSSANSTIISDNISDADGGWWVTPYLLDPNNNQNLYVGYNDVWKSTDGGDNFTQISSINSGDNLRSMDMSPANSNVLYVADKSTIWKTDDGGSTWNDVTGSLPSSYSITYITVKETSEDTLWVTFGGYDANRVYESTDGGATWTNISAGLPNLPVFSIIQNKQVTDSISLYVGTEMGVFVKNGNDNWQAYNDGLPNVMVTELEIYYNQSVPEDSKLRAATYGRGLWESDLYNDPDIIINDIVDTFYVSETNTAEIDISFTISATFSSNTFTAYLSDQDGDFSSEEEIGSLTSDVAGTINGTIAASTPSGEGYRVRVKSSNPSSVSSLSNSFKVVFDNVAPSVSITSDEGSSTSSEPIDISITFSEEVTGFTEEDIDVGNGTVVSFDDANAPEYFVEIEPTESGEVTVDVAAGVATDIVGNENTTASQWSISYTPTSIDLIEQYGIKIYPNPSAGIFTIETADYSVQSVEIVDMSGKIVHQQPFDIATSKEIEVRSLTKGVYILRLHIEDKVVTEKIMIK
ncbi:MAG: T9SS type A sorting domain-containing protein [Bacteroidetes bacterium]|nr:T9SS type A sorting domain-containing protein [Bacteroidota bacterium]